MTEEEAVVVEEVFHDVTPAPKEPAVITVSENDRLRAENINLKLMNATQRETLLQNEINAARATLQNATDALAGATEERQRCIAAVNQYRDELSLAYGIDFNESIIRADDGVVIPRPR